MRFIKEGKKSGVEILRKEIAPEDEPWVSEYVSLISGTILKKLPPDFHSHDLEDKQIEVGNVIYTDLNGRFKDGLILTIVDRILDQLPTTQK